MSNEARVIAPESRSVENTSGSAIAKGTILAAAATGTDGLVEVAAAGAGVLAYGVASEAIADGAVGRAQVRGVALVLAGAALTIGGEVASDASGNAVDATTGDRVLGTALTAAGAGLLAEVDLAGFGPDTSA
jgi:hypothetical protein